MDIVSALLRSKETGERFRRQAWPEAEGSVFFTRLGTPPEREFFYLSVADLLADDWELVEGTGDAMAAVKYTARELAACAKKQGVKLDEALIRKHARENDLPELVDILLSPQAETLGQDKDPRIERHHMGDGIGWTPKEKREAVSAYNSMFDRVFPPGSPCREKYDQYVAARIAEIEEAAFAEPKPGDPDGFAYWTQQGTQPLPPPSPVEEVDVAWPQASKLTVDLDDPQPDIVIEDDGDA